MRGRERIAAGGEAGAAAITKSKGPFSVGDLQKACPGVSVDMIRHVLKSVKQAGEVECLGRGRNATWRRVRG